MLLERTPGNALARSEDQVPGQLGIHVEPSEVCEPAPCLVIHVDPRAVTAQQLDRLRGN